MKKAVIFFTAILIPLFSSSSFAVQIAPSPLAGPEFSKGVHKGRGELVYINYEDVYGGGVQGSKRFALSDRFAITPSLGAFHLTGDQTYTDKIAGKVDMDMDYTFASGGLRGEIQQKMGPVNFILFGGGLFHYGKSDSDLKTANSSGNDSIESTDKGTGWEAGLQAAVKTGPFTTTLFYKYDQLRVDTENDDEPDQEFTFKSSTIGIDLLFNNGISLSGLYSVPDDSNEDEITMLKLGFSF
ncbi:MAG: hypothetical protein AB7E04_09130 [Desulfobacteraceae bacterium]